MTLLTLSMAALSIASPQPGCAIPPGSFLERRVFTNADLDRMAACRYQTGAESEVGAAPPGRPPRPTGRAARITLPENARLDALEAAWRAQWRSIDQKTRRLRGQARELRQEAEEAPRDAKKHAIGRRSPSLLITRARALEAEAQELQDQFEERARREGALPGWIRPKGR